MTATISAPTRTCPHVPPCPPAGAVDHDAARVVFHDETTGWSLLCNGVVAFTDTGELVPDDATHCHAVAPHRPGVPHCTNPDHTHCCKES